MYLYVDTSNVDYYSKFMSENVITGFDEMLRESEERMYADKAQYYKEKGIERRKGRV